jgi:hypothetical protein
MRFLLLICICSLAVPAFSQYNFYFGNIHSHSSYSDGNKDSTASGYYYPGDDYRYAKGSYHMDFLGISEHNHYSSVNNPGMHVADYAHGLYQADTANNDGSFVCMYGFEWGVISSGGHVVTYGVPGLIGWETGSGAWGPTNNYTIYCAKSNYANFWPLVNAYPSAFCTLAHPQTGDYTDLAGAAAYSSSADSAIAGVAIRSGSAFSTTTDYSDPAPTLYENVYLKTLAKGYHLGPTADQDNHYTTFGRNNRIRTVVLANSLKRDSIMAAYKAMRFYASDDWNAQVTFTVNGNYMGSNISTNSNSSIYVSVTDPDAGDNIDSIKIYYGSPGSGINATVLAYNTGSNTLNFTHTTIATNTYYYFARIKQVDGDIIWTSPVWVYRSAVPLPLDITMFSGQQVNKQIDLSWTTAQELNNDHFEIERSSDGIHYNQVGSMPSKLHTSSISTDYTFTDPGPANGTNFYRLKEVNIPGSSNYSDVIAVKFNNPLISIVSINPNPVSSLLNIACNANEATAVTCNFYNSEGRLVRSIATHFNSGQNNISSDVSDLPAGIYFIVLSRPDERIAEAKFVKQ